MQSPIRALLYGIAIWFVWVSLVVTSAQILPTGISGSALFVSMQMVALAALVLGSTVLYLRKVGESSFGEGFLVGLSWGACHDGPRPRALRRNAGDGPRHRRLLGCRRPVVRRNADHYDADDGLPRTEVPRTEILNANGCRSVQRRLATPEALRHE